MLFFGFLGFKSTAELFFMLQSSNKYFQIYNLGRLQALLELGERNTCGPWGEESEPSGATGIHNHCGNCI